jgi:uncharacterized protein
MSTDEFDQSPDSVFTTAIMIEMGLGVLAIVFGWCSGVDVRQWIPRLDAGQGANIAGALALGALAAVPMLIAIELVERINWEPIRKLQELENMPIVSALLGLSVMELMAISVAAGVGEELLVRGWLLGWITGPLTSATPQGLFIGLMVSSIAFGLMHPITPAYAVITFVIGLYLGGLVLFSGNLLIPIAAHTVYDAVHLILAKRQSRR